MKRPIMIKVFDRIKELEAKVIALEAKSKEFEKVLLIQIKEHDKDFNDIVVDFDLMEKKINDLVKGYNIIKNHILNNDD